MGAARDYYRKLMAFLETHNGQRTAVCAFAILATVVLFALPGGIWAYVFGIPFLFFVPGFAVVRLFFWKGTSIEAKFVLSLGLSILVVIFLGLMLVFTIGLDSTTTRVSSVIFTVGAVAFETFVRPAEKYGVDEKTEKKQKKQKPMKVDKVVAAMLATAIGVSAVSLGLIITADYPSTTYFAMTDEYGSADINTTRILGTNITLIIEMKNGEDGPRTFTMIASNESLFEAETYTKLMEKDEVWTVTVTVELNQTGYFRLDFDLFIQEEGKEAYFYGNLHLWISVA